MMKIRTILVILCFVIAAGFTLGATGTIAFSERAERANPEDVRPRLIGVLITREELFQRDEEEALQDAIRQLTDSSSVKDSDRDVKKLYATLVEQPASDAEGNPYIYKKYVFEGVNGYVILAPYFHTEGQDTPYNSIQTDLIASDVSASFKSGDDNTDYTVLKGTICLSDENYAAEGDNDPTGKLIYINPVYETSSGEVYAEPVMGYRLSCYESSTTVTYREEQFTTSESVARSNSVSPASGKASSSNPSGSEFSVLMMRRNPTQRVSVISCGADGSVLNRAEYDADKVPETFATVHGTEYLIVETESVLDGETVTERSLIQKNSSTPGTILYYVNFENGFVIPKASEINWN